MTRVEPSTGTCPQCGTPVITAMRSGTQAHLSAPITLNAEPHPNGTHEAWNRGDIWLARPYAPGAPFHGSRRTEHACPDHQLELA